MAKLVVTTGSRFTDIDALACVIGYKEIPQEEPLAVITGPLNNSVSKTVRDWPLVYKTKLVPGDYEFVIVDLSEAEQFPAFVQKEKVVEIYDHHFGFEKFWRHLGDKAKIEKVGACATLIWEELKKRKCGWEMRSESGSEDKKCVKKPYHPPSPLTPDTQLTSHPHPISPLAANLLYTAIISNTLNFQASVTTQRDKNAFIELTKFTNLPPEWIAKYYQEQEVSIYANPVLAISNDTKLQVIKGIRCAIGQIELWNSKNFIKEFPLEIEAALRAFDIEHWFLTSPSISEGRNYIFTKSEIIKDLLRQVMPIDFFGTHVGLTKKLWLRKEILAKIQ